MPDIPAGIAHAPGVRVQPGVPAAHSSRLYLPDGSTYDCYGGGMRGPGPFPGDGCCMDGCPFFLGDRFHAEPYITHGGGGCVPPADYHPTCRTCPWKTTPHGEEWPRFRCVAVRSPHNNQLRHPDDYACACYVDHVRARCARLRAAAALTEAPPKTAVKGKS